jgi:hypothetical protein
LTLAAAIAYFQSRGWGVWKIGPTTFGLLKPDKSQPWERDAEGLIRLAEAIKGKK